MLRYKLAVLPVLVVLGIALTALPGFTYTLMPFDWTYLGGSPVTVNLKVNANCADVTGELAALQSAMDSWTNSGANFAFNYAGTTSVTNFTYFNFQNDMCWNPGSSGGALATTSTWYAGSNITQADVVFWDTWVWRTSTSGINQYDIESVGVHELGHVLGLDHTNISSAIMYPSIGWWETKRVLQPDDIAGVIAIYGSLGGPSLTVTLTPTGSVNLTGSGGTIPYDVDIHNNTTGTVYFDAWTGFDEVGGGYSQALITRTGLYIGNGGTIYRALNLTVSGSVPNGTYEYWAKTGDYSAQTVIAEDSFEFYKYGDDFSSPWIAETFTTWWDDPVYDLEVVPESFQVTGVYPNPFNPETHISFDLPEAGDVNLSIFNLQGQRVVELLSGDLVAGHYQATWHAAAMPSGTYIYRLTSDQGTVSGKLLLLK